MTLMTGLLGKYEREFNFFVYWTANTKPLPQSMSREEQGRSPVM